MSGLQSGNFIVICHNDDMKPNQYLNLLVVINIVKAINGNKKGSMNFSQNDVYYLYLKNN